MAYDAETFFDEMLALFRANLNTKTAALNAEKGGDSLLKVDFVDADFVLNFDEQVINKDTFVYYNFIDIATPESSAFCVSQQYKMFFSIMEICTDDETLELKKILRYTRALEEIVRENSLAFRVSPLEVETFMPITIEDNDGSSWYRAGGIHVTGTIG